MSLKDQYVQKLEAQIKDWRVELDALKARAEKASTEAKADLAQAYEHLKKQEDELSAKLDGIKKAGLESWEALKHSVEGAWTDLKVTFDKAKAKVTTVADSSKKADGPKPPA